MALAYTENVKKEAESYESLANEIAVWIARVRQQLAHDSDLSIDWPAGSTPSYISEAASGNMTGLPFTRQAVSNFKTTAAQVIALVDGGTPSTGDHLGNINQLSRPLG